MTTDNTREAFEREYNRVWSNSRRARLEANGRYNSLCADRSWSLWQASLTHERARLMPVLEQVSELIGLAKNTGSETYLDKALAAINEVLKG